MLFSFVRHIDHSNCMNAKLRKSTQKTPSTHECEEMFLLFQFPQALSCAEHILISFHFLMHSLLVYIAFLCFLNQYTWYISIYSRYVYIIESFYGILTTVYDCYRWNKAIHILHLYNNIIELNYTEIETALTYYVFNCDFHWPTWLNIHYAIIDFIISTESVTKTTTIVRMKTTKTIAWFGLVKHWFIIIHSLILLVSLLIFYTCIYHVTFIIHRIPRINASICQCLDLYLMVLFYLHSPDLPIIVWL